MNHADHKYRLENEHGRSMEQIMRTVYIEQQLGPATGAKELGIPRQVFLHYVDEYNLKADKFENQ